MFLVEIPELLALVMTLAAVLLEQWGWAGRDMEKPLNEIYTIAQMTSAFPHLPCFLESDAFPTT